MKKRILAVAFGAALLIGGFALNTQNAEAKAMTNVDRGEWTAYYGGASVPQYEICASDWWTDECIVGDKRGQY